MYGWIVNRLRNAEVEHIKNGEDKLAVLCRDAASVVAELNIRNKTLRELLRDRDSTIDALNVSLDTYRGLTEAMQQNQQHRWIPVTERLPEESGNYLTAFGDGMPMAVNEFMHPRGWLTEDGRKAHPHGKWYYGGVTHWMPLPPAPEPPKEET